jgi:hypothetical protein
VVKKTLDDGTTVEEKFRKRRVKGKQKQLQQFIPAEDVLRTIEEAAVAVAEAARADGERKYQGLHTPKLIQRPGRDQGIWQASLHSLVWRGAWKRLWRSQKTPLLMQI